jgi:hypothetical protein
VDGASARHEREDAGACRQSIAQDRLQDLQTARGSLRLVISTRELAAASCRLRTSAFCQASTEPRRKTRETAAYGEEVIEQQKKHASDRQPFIKQ